VKCLVLGLQGGWPLVELVSGRTGGGREAGGGGAAAADGPEEVCEEIKPAA
jgi:hypothetical protein